MGIIFGYILIAVAFSFGAYYWDYRSVANKWWCDNPAEFTAQFVPFHVLIGFVWPVTLFVLTLMGIGISIGWVCSLTFGRLFTVLAKWLNKKGL